MCDESDIEITLTIPQDLLRGSHRLLALQGVSFADYAEAVEGLILELVDSGYFCPRAPNTRIADKKANPEYIQNIRAVFEAAANRSDKSER